VIYLKSFVLFFCDVLILNVFLCDPLLTQAPGLRGKVGSELKEHRQELLSSQVGFSI
jgi:hypothetical protein